MAGDWREVTVGEFAPFAYGRGLPEHLRDPAGCIPVFGSNRVVVTHSEALTSGPTVVIGRKGTVGAVHYGARPCWPIDTTFYVTDPDPTVLRFKYYLLKSPGLEHMNADSAVPGLNREAEHGRKIRIPPLPEQRAIAHVLGTLNDKIELNRRMSETLEAMAWAIFNAWFVDFEPVGAKVEGRWRRGASLPGLAAYHYDFFPDRLVDCELGQIPEGWRVARLGEVFEINPLRRVRKGRVAPYLDMANMPTRGHRPLEVVPCAFFPGRRFINGDTLPARTTLCLENGRTAFVDFLQPGDVGWGSTEYIVLRPKPPLPPDLGYLFSEASRLPRICYQEHDRYQWSAASATRGTSTP
jgi:hypothetical protein